MRRVPARSLLRAAITVVAGGIAATVMAAPAAGDATDDYPIPNRILKTTCTKRSDCLGRMSHRRRT